MSTGSDNGKNTGNQLLMLGVWFSGNVLRITSLYKTVSKYPANPCIKAGGLSLGRVKLKCVYLELSIAHDLHTRTSWKFALILVFLQDKRTALFSDVTKPSQFEYKQAAPLHLIFLPVWMSKCENCLGLC